MEEYYCIFGRISVKRGGSEQLWFVPKTAGGFGVVAAVQSKKVAIFTLIVAVTKLLHNEYRLRLPYPSHIPCLKDNPQNLTKYESKGTLKIPISQMFSKLGKRLKCSFS